MSGKMELTLVTVTRNVILEFDTLDYTGEKHLAGYSRWLRACDTSCFIAPMSLGSCLACTTSSGILSIMAFMSAKVFCAVVFAILDSFIARAEAASKLVSLAMA